MCVAMRVFLIHGMGRTSASMALLGRRLRLAGHVTSSFGYLVSRQSLDTIADRWVEHIERSRHGVAPDDGSFAVVGHSLGNVITRKALPRLAGLSRFVMLAPPNHPPAMARALERSPVFRALTQDAGQKLLDVDGGFYAGLPVPTMPSLIIAGDGGPRFARSPWKGGANDGVVSVDETRLAGIETVVVDAIHTLIMNQREVAGLALRFLAS
jgi:hypothetical protein